MDSFVVWEISAIVRIRRIFIPGKTNIWYA